MIPIPTGWRLEGAPGAGLTLTAAAGARHGRIRYSERCRPQQPMEAILAGGGRSGWRVERARRLVTVEGEYAAVATLRGDLGGAAAQRTVGCVFADDFYSLVEGLAVEAGAFAEVARVVEELVYADRHMLGERRRKLLYRAPAGWSAHHELFLSTHRDPARAATRLTVLPALPAPGGFPAGLARDLAETTLQSGLSGCGLAVGEPVATAHGLAGTLWGTTGWQGAQRVARSVAVLVDDRFSYAAQIDSDLEGAAAARGALRTLIDTIEPIPRPARAAGAGGRRAVDFWT